jgi:outer membrane murein-binding lipoprotein Lpp
VNRHGRSLAGVLAAALLLGSALAGCSRTGGGNVPATPVQPPAAASDALQALETAQVTDNPMAEPTAAASSTAANSLPTDAPADAPANPTADPLDGELQAVNQLLNGIDSSISGSSAGGE